MVSFVLLVGFGRPWSLVRYRDERTTSSAPHGLRHILPNRLRFEIFKSTYFVSKVR
ncbi:hypothetical protein ZOD2009_11985 [Haladaptatus paucihalophilus DX253]|uniref:Uncharacterized protein n=1 Tax=Haladaptatus paucihalophilus DX253 TaxID=797209 RepID=E7QUB7_HALPU|nr:hypothetical protein ZOD2009_11985 [Haladaptatus paucihalophilus DX253]